MAGVWPDTVVEENNLNKNISVLRQLLGEAPGEHRFIVTVPGKGYKFVATVADCTLGDIQEVEVVPPQGTVPVLVPSDSDSKRRPFVTSVRLRYGLVAAVVFVSIATIYFWQVKTSRDAEAIHSIAVLPLENLTGDPGQEYFVDGMTEALITELGKI